MLSRPSMFQDIWEPFRRLRVKDFTERVLPELLPKQLMEIINLASIIPLKKLSLPSIMESTTKKISETLKKN